ncbi:histidinol-phosphate transaminase [Alkalibacter rhizosphaerae]|uniref:Histidinol-phosphate aminotransferase n=1 Tax=Alkalibacter rhizosphaerae TaxID=2815577 RepID=A0A974XEF7_9FIRM|nr:histidinol-phosphate transaminase [Alkalibacter rhizosphaerae]QSX08246.1 histidinol-phosphate transaminase [Alkalibacter rhizosphaerae]
MPKKSIRKAVEFVNPYVPGKTIDEVQEAYGLDEVIKLGSNENPYGPFDNAKEAMIQEIDQLFMYPDREYEDLKVILAEMNGLQHENVALAHGAGGMLETLARTFIEEGDEVILPTQSYGLYREISNLMGAKVIESSLNAEYKIDMKDMMSKFSDKTKLIWMCNPNNPTGTMLDQAMFDVFLEKLPEKAWIIMDEAYIEFSDPAKRIESIDYIKKNKRIIVIRTMSKAFGLAGARIGYAFANKEMIHIIDTVAEPFNANRIGLAGAIATLTKDQKTYEKRLQDIISERENLVQQLTKMGMNCIPTQTNFVFFETGRNASAIGEEMLKRGVIVRPCTGWGYEEAIRVTIGTEYENQRFLEEFGKVIKEIQ